MVNLNGYGAGTGRLSIDLVVSSNALMILAGKGTGTKSNHYFFCY